MERADAERLVERTLEKVQHSAPAVLLRRHLKVPDVLSTAIVAAAATAASIIGLGASGVSAVVTTFLPIYVLKQHGKAVFNDSRRVRTLVVYFIVMQLLYVAEALRRNTLLRVIARFVDGNNWRRSYYLAKTIGLALVIQCDFKAHNAMQMVIQDAPAAVEHATKTVTETFAKLDTPVKSSQKEKIP
eukprot:CAMPEP_0195508400 /NCGR_PEP_ID=MMETSP0794_2-20130614/1609_1 /TAXON_ID=515487 /ORGANISM="Stephanopyxis turris, Strain CCMP 815" /LENGTH=186 /DNA_ID=CAMNT_0040635345 /DNA_START=55 /DNA_END=615 /DNA_ORIENTATION=+